MTYHPCQSQKNLSKVPRKFPTSQEQRDNNWQYLQSSLDVSTKITNVRNTYSTAKFAKNNAFHVIPSSTSITRSGKVRFIAQNRFFLQTKVPRKIEHQEKTLRIQTRCQGVNVYFEREQRAKKKKKLSIERERDRDFYNQGFVVVVAVKKKKIRRNNFMVLYL